MNRLFRITFISICILLAVSVNSSGFWGKDKPIKLDQVPEPVMAAAKEKLKGFMPESAEEEKGKKYTEYEIEGTSNGKRYSIEVKVNKAGEGKIALISNSNLVFGLSRIYQSISETHVKSSIMVFRDCDSGVDWIQDKRLNTGRA